MHAAVAVSSSAATARLPFRRCLRSPLAFRPSSSPPMFHISSPSRSSHSSTSSPVQTLATSAGSIPGSPSALEPAKPRHQHPWLFVGLGNPGKQYQGTRHNAVFKGVVGFTIFAGSCSVASIDTRKEQAFENIHNSMALLLESEGISMSSITYKALLGKGFIGEVPVFLAKPQTFMNASGESVGAIVSYYKIPLNQVLVIFDDMDLPFAKLRLLPKGGHGGHNGMRSIINRFKGNRDFPRLRIGIGRPPGKMDAVNFVLHKFSKQESRELEMAFERGLEAMRVVVLEGFNKSANLANSAKPLQQLGG